MRMDGDYCREEPLKSTTASEQSLDVSTNMISRWWCCNVKMFYALVACWSFLGRAFLGSVPRNGIHSAVHSRLSAGAAVAVLAEGITNML